eukprot:TRINITY_DN4449_c0_g1_i1.p1 TRINITY_DN4449_c0_g1~~TRINITY_DN4449_c0_g1_i1.p1  ORF type:complete len:783 (-),score=105.20 TRINITY_DN4449_c0_g1_i1:38-2386(-)
MNHVRHIYSALPLLCLLFASGPPAGSLVINYANFTGTESMWSFVSGLTPFVPYIDTVGYLHLTDGSIQINNLAKYNGFFEGGSAFRFVVTFGYPGGYAGEFFSTAIVDQSGNEWISFYFMSFLDPSVCFKEHTAVQYECFKSIPELDYSDNSFNEFTMEYHNNTNQAFVFLNKSSNPTVPPIGQWHLTQPLPKQCSFFFRGYAGGAIWTSMIVKSIYVNTETFVPTPIIGFPAFKKPQHQPLISYFTTNFSSTNGWANSPTAQLNLDGSISLGNYGPSVSWLSTSISISPLLQVNFTFKFTISGDEYGMMFVIQNQGINIAGSIGGYFGYATFDGWGLAISPNRQVYLYNSFPISSPDFNIVPDYPRQTCDSITLNDDLTVSMTIDLFTGHVQGSITNQTASLPCWFAFDFSPCTAMKAWDSQTYSAWIGFTSSYGSFSQPKETITSVNITSFASVAPLPALCSVTPSVSISSSVHSSGTPSVTPPQSSLKTVLSTTPSLTRSLTPAPTKSPKTSPSPLLFVINKICSSAALVKCPSGDCVNNAAMCTGDINTSTPVASITKTLPLSSEGRPILINVISPDNSLIAALRFPPNVLKPKWVVSINNPLDSYNETSKFRKKDCEDDVPFEIVSPSFQITVRDDQGRKVSKFSKSFSLSSFAQFSSDEARHICFGYLNELTDDQWKCTSESNLKSTQTKQLGVHLVEENFDHFTTFAVLLGGDTKCSPDWVWITSLSVLAAALVWVFLCVVLFYWNVRFRAWMSGYETDLKVSTVVEKAKKRHEM